MATLYNNKETFELLRGSPDSNSASDLSEIVIPVKKKRFRRRLKNNPSTQQEEINICQCKAKTFTLVLLSFMLICWLVTLTWLAFVLHGELNRLASQVSKVVAGIQEVPDALQKCHTLSKDLQKNQSQITSRLTGFSFMLNNFSFEMDKVKSGLQAVQDQLKSSPDLVNNPRLVKDLSASVATFGSQIKDLNSTVSTLKEQNGKLDSLVGNLVSNVTEMKIKLTELSNAQVGKGILTEKQWTAEKEAILTLVNQVSRNLSSINETLSNKLLWTVQDRSKDHTLIENLREMNENITARVKTLEGLCAKNQQLKPFVGDQSQNVVQSEPKSNPSSVNPGSPSLTSLSNVSKETGKPKMLENPP